ncbi:hypothetical protein MC885_019940 [Smutsia gigantea]|nr:hypothetical protein MC885_019940 [Smutsia gigantea]
MQAESCLIYLEKQNKPRFSHIKEAMLHFHKAYGGYQDRVFLHGGSDNDASMVLVNLILGDYWKYKCEVIEGLEDGTDVVALHLQAVRYLVEWTGLVGAMPAGPGMGLCSTPFPKSKEPCGGRNIVPSVRNYSFGDKDKSRYDVFCFTSNYNGCFYYVILPTKQTYDEIAQICLSDGAQIVKVGQIFVAWNPVGYDHCDMGWVADSSVHSAISRPKEYCSPTEAAVCLVAFPDKKHKLYGVYCFRA